MSIAIADITGDGRNDIVVGANHAPNADVAVIVLAQTPTHAFAPSIVFLANTAGAEAPNMIAVADFDGDARLDVAVIGLYDIRVLLQDASGQLGIVRNLVPSGNSEAELIAAGDFDGDGRADLVAAAYNAPGADVWYQAEGLNTTHNTGCPHVGDDSIAIADLDGDGADDVAISSYYSASVCVLRHQPGGFAPATIFPLTERPAPEYIAAGDVDGDGRKDLVVASGGPQAVEKYLDVLHQNVDGTFTLTSSLDSQWYANGLLLADIDGDGRLDGVVSIAELEIDVFRQLPIGGFANRQVYAYNHPEGGGPGPQRTAIGDLNGDGKPDVASVGTDVMILYHQ